MKTKGIIYIVSYWDVVDELVVDSAYDSLDLAQSKEAELHATETHLTNINEITLYGE